MKRIFGLIIFFLFLNNGYCQSDIHIKRSLKYAKKAGKKYDKGKYKRSIALYSRAVSQYPEHEFNYYHRGMAYKAIGEAELAFKDFDRSIMFNTNSLNSYYERGLIHLNSERYDKAAKDFENHIKINGESDTVLVKLADAYIGLTQFQNAISTLSKVILSNPNESDLYLKRAYCFIYNQQMSEVRRELKIVDTLGNTSNERYFVEGVFYLNGGQAKKAINLLKKAVDSTNHSQRNGLYYHTLSHAFHADKRYTDAVKSATVAIHIQGKKNYYYDRGCYAAEAGNIDLALSDFAKTIDLDSTYTAAYNNRTFYIWFPQKKYQNAVNDLTKIIALDSLNAYAYSNRSYAYYSLGKIERGFLDAFKSVELNAENPYVYKNLALLYHAINEDEEAINSCKGAIKWGFPKDSDPEFTELLKTLDLIK